jgi:hypothetical protein
MATKKIDRLREAAIQCQRNAATSSASASFEYDRAMNDHEHRRGWRTELVLNHQRQAAYWHEEATKAYDAYMAYLNKKG